MKNNFIKISFLVLSLLAVVVLPSCLKDKYNQQLEDEKNQITEYIKSHDLKDSVTSDGLHCIIKVRGSGDTIKAITDYVVIKYRASLLSGYVYDSTDPLDFSDLASNGTYPSFAAGGPLTLGMNMKFYALVKAISLLHEGGKGTFIMPSALTGSNFEPHVYDLELIKVYHNIADSRRHEFIDSTMLKIGFTLKDSTKSGVWIDTTNVVGAGTNFPINTDRVSVSYEAKIIDGYTGNVVNGRTLLSRTISYPLDTILPPHFNPALFKMTRWGTAKVYIPYYNAYGSAGLYSDDSKGQILVPPYSNLEYDITFLGFMKLSDDKKSWILDTARK